MFQLVDRETLRGDGRLLDRAGLRRRGVQRLGQADAVLGAVDAETAVYVCVRHELFAAGVDEEADEVLAHVVAAEVGEGFGEVGFVEVDLWRGKIG